ncbi:MAG: CCA tRNA nucleotidyltransferase [Bacteroidales bacterium]|nr:CCA tRNA nucleotidyltransferase [Bacteroidales bacterium]
MKKLKRKLFAQKLTHPVFALVADAASQLNANAYVVGGWVRDLLLERKSKDIDIVIVGSGIELAEIIAKKLPGKQELKIFKNFGTAMLRIDDWEIEFVGARKESYRANSRKPIVEDGSLEDDISRRDFNINAMAISLNSSDFGELIDLFDGRKDLNEKIIRTPLDPDITYSDDPLRMMRAIRFASQLDFNIEYKSFESIKKNAHRLNIVSIERIMDEFNKIMMTSEPSKGLKMLRATGLLKEFFPELDALHGVDVIDGKAHKDNFFHTVQVLDNLCRTSDDLWLRWAALMHDIAKPRTREFDPEAGWTFHGHEFVGAKMIPGIFKKLRLPLTDKMKYVQKLVLLHLRPIVLSQSIVSDSAVRRLLFEAGDDIDDLMTLCEADITSANEYKVQRYLKNFELVRQKLREIEEKDKLRNWQPPVTGNDIMETFELKPCKEVGIIKTAIREAILDGVIPNERDAAYDFMLKQGKKLGLTPKNVVN